MITKKISVTVLMSLALPAIGEVVDFDKIQHWTGEGPNKAAFLVQFTDNGPAECYVWGYRWAEGATPNGENMIREIASHNNNLLLFTQYTGNMGSTVCGLGYSENQQVSEYVKFDFENAKSDGNVNFDYFSPNTSMGQTSAPGWDTPRLCQEAINLSKTTNIIDHPINAQIYGYPAYDYDWWQMSEPLADLRWQAGWYDGYWSFWLGGTDVEKLEYSGLGMSSQLLSDGGVYAWCYRYLNPDKIPDGITGATSARPSNPLNYELFGETSSVIEVNADDGGKNGWDVFTLTGVAVARNAIERSIVLEPGVYIMRQGKVTKKVIIK